MRFSFETPYPSRRSPVMARNVVSASQPLAAQAGLEMLMRGGNAADAAVAAAVALTVVEPTGNGIGSDAFAILWDGKRIEGLNASGRAPAAWTPDRFAGRMAMPLRGWDSVTVPGAVSAWVALAKQYGRLPFASLCAPAIRLARDGFHVSPRIAALWAQSLPDLAGQPGFSAAYAPGGRAPRAGEVFALPDQAVTLTAIAETDGAEFYRGALAKAMVAHSAANGGALSLDDLAGHTADWVAPISTEFDDVSLHEIPPNGQGIAALIALGILRHAGLPEGGPDAPETLHAQIEAMKLAFADVYAEVADPGAMRVTHEDMLDDAYLARRAALIDPDLAGDPGPGRPSAGGTVYLATADSDGMMVSFVQSNYKGFGSGVVVPGTGISLQNRGCGFSVVEGHPNRVGPSKRPFQTILPAFLSDRDGPAMAFGVMGGPMQPQGHLQLTLRMRRFGQSPQTAIDAPRWRVMTGRQVAIEPGLPPETISGLKARGHHLVSDSAESDFAFGGAQAIHRIPGGYVAGSDGRKDGCALGF